MHYFASAPNYFLHFYFFLVHYIQQKNDLMIFLSFFLFFLFFSYSNHFEKLIKAYHDQLYRREQVSIFAFQTIPLIIWFFPTEISKYVWDFFFTYCFRFSWRKSVNSVKSSNLCRKEYQLQLSARWLTKHFTYLWVKICFFSFDIQSYSSKTWRKKLV